MVKAVIFDLDDTLIPEKQYVKSGFHHIARILCNKFEISEADIFADLIELFEKSSQNVFNRLLDQYKIYYTKEMVFELVQRYRHHFPEISFYDDVLPCIEHLKSNNLKIGIITDGYTNVQRQKLKAVNANTYFDEIIITDELGYDYWKPHPKAFAIMRDKLNVEFTEMMYVGDNPEKDFYISKTYPIRTVRVFREGFYKEKAYLDNVMEVHSIYGLDELKSIIDKLTNGCKDDAM